MRSLSPWLLLCYGPLWDNLWAGQLNTWVLVTVVMALWSERRGHERATGLWLSIAILLKSSPALLLLWLLVNRRWRSIVWAIGGVVVCSALAAVIWTPELFVWHLTSLRSTIGVEFWFSNLGVRAFAERVVGGGAAKWVTIAAFVVAVAAALRRGDTFSRLVIVMTVFSPLVWYHHLVNFVIPIALHLRFRPIAVWCAVACVQLERPIEDHWSWLTGVPALGAAALLFAAADTPLPLSARAEPL